MSSSRNLHDIVGFLKRTDILEGLKYDFPSYLLKIISQNVTRYLNLKDLFKYIAIILLI